MGWLGWRLSSLILSILMKEADYYCLYPFQFSKENKRIIPDAPCLSGDRA
jgi:hypothetical protein